MKTQKAQIVTIYQITNWIYILLSIPRHIILQREIAGGLNRVNQAKIDLPRYFFRFVLCYNIFSTYRHKLLYLSSS